MAIFNCSPFRANHGANISELEKAKGKHLKYLSKKESKGKCKEKLK